MIRRAVASGLLAALAAGGGCVPLVSHYRDDLPTRRNVEKALEGGPDLRSLTPEEVLLRLGEPDAALAREGAWSYRWTKLWGVLLLPPAMLTRTQELTVTFGPDRRVAALDQKAHGGFRLVGVGGPSAGELFEGMRGIHSFFLVPAGFFR
jgi:hypothetical protein